MAAGHGAVALATGATAAHEAELAAHEIEADDRPTAAGHGGHDDHVEPHESPLVLTIPLMILSFFAITVGWLNMPWGLITRREVPRVGGADGGLPAGRARRRSATCLAIISVGLVVVAVVFVALALPEQLRHVPRAHRAQPGWRGRATSSSCNKYYLDDLYENVIVYGIKKPIASARATGSTST